MILAYIIYAPAWLKEPRLTQFKGLEPVKYIYLNYKLKNRLEIRIMEDQRLDDQKGKYMRSTIYNQRAIISLAWVLKMMYVILLVSNQKLK